MFARCGGSAIISPPARRTTFKRPRALVSKHPLFADPALMRLTNEYLAIRDNNERARRGEHTRGEALFAEGALLLVVIERFLRVLLRSAATTDHTLPNLLDMAMSDGFDLLDPPVYFPAMPAATNRAFSKQMIVAIRNPILHGNYEQAADDSIRGKSVKSYFEDGTYRLDLQNAHDFFVSMVRQFDMDTGDRRQDTMRRREIHEQQRREARQEFVSALSRRARRMSARR